jgi:tetratricopeptide (TPR) repeat protein
LVAHWLDRAEQYAAGLSQPQLVEVSFTLCGAMMTAGRDRQVDRILATIRDPQKRADRELMICMLLSGEGKFDAAIRRAQSLPAERRPIASGKSANSWRAGALFNVARLQASAYDFAGATKTLKLIDDPETVSWVYNHLAEDLAKAGLYAEAEENLAKCIPADEDYRKSKEETRQLIARYKAEGRKDPPPKREARPKGAYYEGLRRVSTIFGDTGIKLDNLAEAKKAEKAAEHLDGAVNRATAWREIAWAYYDMRGADEQNLERCRRAIENSIRNAEKISPGLGQSYLRAVAFASAANLYLELGETDLAKQMVKKADAVDLDVDMLGGLNSFTTTPLLIAILVRVGEIDGAMALAEKMQKAADKQAKDAFPTNTDIVWSTWATVCTLEGKAACVERQLEKMSNARIKAVLCAGVATGLLELQQRGLSKKP